MKTVYSKPLWLIAAFYALTVIVGTGQIYWAFRFGVSYSYPSDDGFYMLYRMAFSIAILLLFALKHRESLFWAIVIESATNIFATGYFIYIAVWHIVCSENMEEFRELVSLLAPQTGWNSLLCLISAIILGYMISNWNVLMSQPIFPADRGTDE